MPKRWCACSVEPPTKPSVSRNSVASSIGGVVDRQRGGSHRIFSRDDVAEILNLQPRPDGTAKPYQVRQVREVILRYQLADSLVREAVDA